MQFIRRYIKKIDFSVRTPKHAQVIFSGMANNLSFSVSRLHSSIHSIDNANQIWEINLQTQLTSQEQGGIVFVFDFIYGGLFQGDSSMQVQASSALEPYLAKFVEQTIREAGFPNFRFPSINYDSYY